MRTDFATLSAYPCAGAFETDTAYVVVMRKRPDVLLLRDVLDHDITGARLARNSAAWQAMIDWLRLPAPADPIDDYRTWRTRVLHDSFGARRFVELPLTQSDIYR